MTLSGDPGAQCVRTVKLALVGLGEHGREVLLPTLRILPNVKIEALCDLSHERLIDKSVVGFGIPSYTKFDDLLKATAIDGVVLAGTPQMHEELSMQAIASGISVFVEKPPSVTTSNLRVIAHASEQARVVTGVGLNFRFAEPIRLIDNYIRRRNLKIISVSLKHTSSKPRKGLWGLDRIRSFLLAQVIHPLDTMIFFGGRVESSTVSSYIANDDFTIALNLRFQSGAMGHLITGSDSPKFENVLEIITAEDVVFRLDNMWRLSVLDLEILPADLDDRKRWQLEWQPSPLNSGFSRSGYENELSEFCDSILTKKTFSPNFTDVVYLYELLDAVEASLRDD